MLQFGLRLGSNPRCLVATTVPVAGRPPMVFAETTLTSPWRLLLLPKYALAAVSFNMQSRAFRASIIRCCAGFRTPAMTRPATGSETGVGKAPRHEIAGEWAPSVPRGLWGFSRGVRLGKVGSNCPRPSRCLAGWVWTTGGAGVAEADWQCHHGPI